MSEHEIQHTDWRTFCEQFTHKHRGWLVSVQLFSTGPPGPASGAPENSSRELTRDVPLDALTAVPNPHGTSLFLQTGGDKRTTRLLIEHPVRLRLHQTDSGADQALCIDAADGQTARVAFRVPAHPETLNGLTESEFGSA